MAKQTYTQAAQALYSAGYTRPELISGYSLPQDATDEQIGEQAVMWQDVDPDDWTKTT